MTFNRSHGVSGIVLAAVFHSLACSPPGEEAVESETVVPVKVIAAARTSVRGSVHATGIVTPAPGADLVVVAPEAARIAEIPHASGDRVRRGDLLVRFEIPSAAAEVQRQQADATRVRAALETARAAQTRARGLFERGVAAHREVEEADRAVAEAEAAIAQADASIGAAQTVAARSIVYATFDGVIIKRTHNQGDVVESASGDPILRVIDPRRLEIVASIPLADSFRVAMRAPGRLVAPDQSNPGLQVVSIPAAVEPGTASVPVRLAFTAPTTLPVGAPVQVDIDAEEHSNVIAVPANAVVREGEETAVFVVNGDKAERRPVRLGLADGALVEIVDGIKAGDHVIVDGQAGLPDGATVRTSEAAGSQAEKGGRP